MISTQTFENYPEFANAGQKSQPNDAKYAAGFIPSDVLPAEWLNWFLSGATKGVTALNTGVKSIEQEINAVLASRAVTPDITATNQLLTVLNKIKAEAVLAAHPVGSLYWTSKNENPAVTFGGGTWKQITDKFVLAAGSTYKAESTGGAPTVTLTVANLPSHSHTFTPSGTVKSTFTGASHSHTFTPGGTVKSTFTGTSHSHTFTPSGSIKPHNHGMLHYHTYSGDTSGGLGRIMGSCGDRNENNFNIVKMYADKFAPFTLPKSKLSVVDIDSMFHLSRMYAPSSSTDNTGLVYDLNHTHSYSGLTSGPQYDASSKGVTDDTTTTFTGTQQTVSATQGGTVASAFTGKQITTSATQGGTVASSFTGTYGTTSSTGSNSSINIMPPYIVKYCWERTA